ncbi:hypothetical protein B0H67DRAFT_602102 [Lasiosphaeris hirsuta]|uniref:Uncharacterized protein n=1 Tax=Lasiosphaeris hirsuta TaxID=260670 RepID=A0AA40A8J8_9PEZI|nr:hypothetical protein B0H67DRAFT_602102 [Lasiosphaeris hirsuta]
MAQQRQVGNKIIQPVVMPTPFLRRVRNHQLSSSPATTDAASADLSYHTAEALPQAGNRCQHPVTCCPSTKCAFELELASLRATIDPEKHALFESTYRALDSLLKATCPRKTRAAAPRSLLAMCLRKMPEYMAELERWERKDAEVDRTKSALNGSRVSFEVYEELESLGTATGWRHLCLVVRAHGIRIIQEAVAEGLLDDAVTDLLIRLCLQNIPLTECTALIDSFIFRQYPNSKKPDEDLFTAPMLGPLELLKSWDVTGGPFLLGKLAVLFESGQLPAQWIFTKGFATLWAAATRLVAGKAPYQQEPSNFIIAAIDVLGHFIEGSQQEGMPDSEPQDRGRAQKFLIGAVAALGSLVVLGQEGVESNESMEISLKSKAASLNIWVDYILYTCTDHALDRRKGSISDLGTYLLQLCSFLSFRATGSASAVVESAWRQCQDYKKANGLVRQYDATLSLLGTMAHYCSRGTYLSPNDYLSRFCDKLETLHLPGNPLGNIRVDGAFVLAEYTGDLRDLAFAENLRAKSKEKEGSRKLGQQAGVRNAKDEKEMSLSGFRWDDDIGEWITTDKRNVPIEPAPRRPKPVSLSCSAIDLLASTARNPKPRASKPPVADEESDSSRSDPATPPDLNEDTKRGSEQGTKQAAEQDTEQDTDQDTEQDTDQDTDQDTEQDTDQDTDQDTEQDTDQDTDQDTEQDTEQGTEQDTEQDTYQAESMDDSYLSDTETSVVSSSSRDPTPRARRNPRRRAVSSETPYSPPTAGSRLLHHHELRLPKLRPRQQPPKYARPAPPSQLLANSKNRYDGDDDDELALDSDLDGDSNKENRHGRNHRTGPARAGGITARGPERPLRRSGSLLSLVPAKRRPAANYGGYGGDSSDDELSFL